MTALLPVDFKALVCFDVGTYWVYQDSATQALDSVWVTKVDSSILTDKDGSTIISYTELLRTHVLSSASAHGLTYAATSSCFPNITNPEGCALLMRTREVRGSAEGDPATTGFVLEYPLPAGQLLTLKGAGTGLYLYRHAAPLAIGPHTYANVVQAIQPRDNSENGALVTYYWAPNHGLVRRRIRGLNRPVQAWTLLREHIVQ